MFSWLMYTHHCCETKTQHWVLLFNAFTKRHRCYYITDLILKDYLGNYISVYLFPFTISCLLLYTFKTLSEKGFMGVTRLPKGSMQLQRPRWLLWISWQPRTAIHPLPKSVPHSLPPNFHFPVLLPPSPSVFFFFSVCGIPPLQATEKNKFPPSSQFPHLPHEGNADRKSVV